MNLKNGLDWHAQQGALRLCNFATREEVESLETLATKALGVLQENGIYPSILFLQTRRAAEKDIAAVILNELHALVSASRVAGARACRTPGDYLRYYSDEICGDLDKLLLTKALWEQTLIYTRYAAKAIAPSKPQAQRSA